MPQNQRFVFLSVVLGLLAVATNYCTGPRYFPRYEIRLWSHFHVVPLRSVDTHNATRAGHQEVCPTAQSLSGTEPDSGSVPRG